MNNPVFHEADWSHDHSVAARCLALLERHAPRYMTGASFGLSREIDQQKCHRMAEEDRARCERLLLQHKGRNQLWIARQIGFSQTSVSVLWRKMVREGRTA